MSPTLDETSFPASVPGPFLLVVDGGHLERVSLPRSGRVQLGRGESAQVLLDDPGVSRLHAELELDDGAVRVTDLGSRNGTFVNGERLSGTRDLRERDLVSLGQVTILCCSERPPAQGGAPPAAPRTARPDPIIADAAMLKAYMLLEELAPLEVPVLFVGEPGAGKRRAARALHERSSRSGGPFVVLQAAAAPAPRVEARLFGSPGEGAGLLESAHGGTLYLEEVGALSPQAQARLVHELERMERARAGEPRLRPHTVRVIAATSRELGGDLAARRLRLDLYHRIGGATITLPPLRLRPGELRLFAERFAEDACAPRGREPLGFQASTIDAMGAYRWPGNLDELRDAMTWASILTPPGASVIPPAFLPAFISAPPLERAGSLASGTPVPIGRLRRSAPRTEAVPPAIPRPLEPVTARDLETEDGDDGEDGG